MEDFKELLVAGGMITIILIGITILNWILYLILTSDVSSINKRLKETNKLLLAMINEQRRINDNKPNYYKQDGQAQQMDSIEPPKL